VARIAKFLKEMLLYEGAETLLLRSLELHQALRGENHESVAKTHYLLAQLYWNQGKWDMAEPHCLKSLSIREAVLGPQHTKVAKCLCGLGGTLRAAQKFIELEMWIERDPLKAKPLLERSLNIFEANVCDNLVFVHEAC
jgi:tetratricopeptide (TPR) repeat protein